MKRYFRIIIILLLVLNTAFVPRPRKLIGYWEVIRLESKDGGIEESRERFIQFFDDRTIEAGNIGFEPTKIGMWELDKRNKIVTFTSKTKSNSDGEYEILKLKRTEMILKRESISIFLEEVKIKN